MWANERGLPQAIRCDNGPELTSRHFLAWCIERKIELLHIQPGRPMQNGHVESFHGKLRDECLRVSWFGNLFQARRKIVAWQADSSRAVDGHTADSNVLPEPLANSGRPSSVDILGDCRFSTD